jgi:glycosyltransferase involved in cell wall biosynthesis
LKIAQVAPLYESVPPKLYGGTERVVSYLTEELVNQGHEVTLFASGDSVTKARLISPCEQSLRLDAACIDHLAHHVLLLEQVSREAPNFDMIHFHVDYMHFPLSRHNHLPNVTTLHGRLDLPDLVPLYKDFREMPLVSISNAQRIPLPWVNWQATVYHGLPEDLYELHPGEGRYLAFLGRISPEKGVDVAIEIAKRVGIELRIAAKIDRVDEPYYRETIEPLLDDSRIEFVGEIGEAEKNEFLGNAMALLAPGDWPEPFGLVMIEAMACGTPTVGLGRGSIPEVIDDGKSGFAIQNVDEAVAAVNKIHDLSRRTCRETFTQRFTASRMARDYVEVYHRLLEAKGTKSGSPGKESWKTSSA